MTVKGIVFDKDGTLFDFTATWAAWVRRVMDTETAHSPDQLPPLADVLGFDLDNDVFYPSSMVIAGTAQEIVEAALPFIQGTDIDEVLERWNDWAAAAPQVEAAPLAPLLGRLKDAGLRLGVATNDAELPARVHLDVAGVSKLFDFIAGSDSGHGGKPAPGQLLAFCAQTGLQPKDCVMVGDSTHDLKAGRAAGMVCVAVLTGVAARGDLAPFADVVLPSVAELPDWLGV